MTIGDVSDAPDDGSDQPSTAEPSGSSRRPIVLIVLATVLAVVSVTTTWVKTEALETDSWVETSDAVLEEPEVRQRLAVYLTDELYASVDVAAELESLLPEDLAGLSGPLAGALRDPATAAVERVLASEQFAGVWSTANSTAHEKMVRILRGETRDSVDVDDGEVVLDLAMALANIGETLGLPDAAIEKIPDDAGRIVVFESSELATAQKTVRVLEFLSWFLFLVVVALYVTAVIVAGDRRRVTLRNVGLALAVGGSAVLVLRSLSVRVLVDTVVADPSNETVATTVASVATQTVDQMGWSAIVFGVGIAAFAALLGEHRWATATRRWMADTPNPTAVAAGAALALLVVVAWIAPGSAFDRLVTALTLLALLIGAVVSLSLVLRDERDEAPAPSDDLEPEPASPRPG